MPVADSDITFRLSGGAGNADQNASLGGIISSTAWAGGTLHDLFDAVSGDENLASRIEYRCIYVRNGHATLAWGPNIYAWFSAPVAGGATLALGWATQGVGNGTATGVASTIANETTPPSPAVTFVDQATAASKAAGVVITGGAAVTIPALSVCALWIKRSAANTAAVAADGATLNVQGDAL